MNPIVNDVVAALCAARRAQGISRRSVAGACSVPEQIIRHIERAEIEPTTSVLVDYAEHVNLHLRLELSERTPPREQD